MNAGDRLTILETCIYCSQDELEATESFYAEVLGLRRVSSWPGSCAYRVGDGVLLLFERAALAGRDSPAARHGSVGPSHTCLLARDREEYERLMLRLTEAGVEITHEEQWPAGRRSFYFTDPAGNLLEIADGDMWPA